MYNKVKWIPVLYPSNSQQFLDVVGGSLHVKSLLEEEYIIGNDK